MTFEMPGNITTYVDIMTYANSVTGGMFGVGAIVTLTIITYMASLQWGSQRAILFASYIGFVLSVLFLIMGLVSDQIAYIFIIFMALPTLLNTFKVLKT